MTTTARTTDLDQMPATTPRYATVRSVALGAIAAACLALTACGGGTNSPSVGVPTLAGGETVAAETNANGLEAPTDMEEAFALFNTCLEEQGVSFPEVPIGGNAVEAEENEETALDDANFEALEKASALCEGHLANVDDQFEISPEQEAAFADAELAFRDCVVEEGYDPAALGMDADGEVTDETLDNMDLELLDEVMEACGSVFDDALGTLDAETSTP